MAPWRDRHVLEVPRAKRAFLPRPLGWPFRVADFYREAGLSAAFSELRGRVLDFGCGEKPYEQLLKGSAITRWTGLDLEQRTSGSQKPNKADFFWDGRTLPFEKDSFDVVLATQVLEHVPDLERTLSEISRVLVPGGALVITVPMTSVLHEEPHDYRRFTPYGVSRDGSLAGLRLIEAMALGGPVTTLTTLLACHCNPLRRIPFLGGLVHAISIGTVTQTGYWLELLLFKAGFTQHLVTTDYLFVLRKD